MNLNLKKLNEVGILGVSKIGTVRKGGIQQIINLYSQQGENKIISEDLYKTATETLNFINSLDLTPYKAREIAGTTVRISADNGGKNRFIADEIKKRFDDNVGLRLTLATVSNSVAYAITEDGLSASIEGNRLKINFIKIIHTYGGGFTTQTFEVFNQEVKGSKFTLDITTFGKLSPKDVVLASELLEKLRLQLEKEEHNYEATSIHLKEMFEGELKGLSERLGGFGRTLEYFIK